MKSTSTICEKTAELLNVTAVHGTTQLRSSVNQHTSLNLSHKKREMITE
jgi:hypothetical protein